MNPSDDNDDMEECPKIPYRRDRTPSIVVQSLGLSFQKDSAITGSIEVPDDDSSPSTSEASDPKSCSTSGVHDNEARGNSGAGAADARGPCDSSGNSAKGSSSSLANSSASPTGWPAGGSSPLGAGRVGQLQQQQHQLKQQLFNSRPDLVGGAVGGGATGRRLSLNIGSTAPRRQSLTVEGLSSASLLDSSSAAATGAGGGNATGSLRNKVALKPGHSLMGWIKLASTAKDLAGTGGKILEVTPEELAKHDRREDCWVALKGNVYNVTVYLNYHPGGVEELMRGAGRDATELFNEVHRWVNYESILAKCLVGPYKLDSPMTPKGRATFKTISEDSAGQPPLKPPSAAAADDGPLRGRLQNQIGSNPALAGQATANNEKLKRRDPTVAQRPNRRQSIALTVPSPNKYQSLLLNNNSSSNLNQIQQPPTYVIMQDKSSIKVKIQDLAATLPQIRSRHLICDLNEQLVLHLSIILSPDWLYRIHLKLDQQVDRSVAAVDLSPEDRIVTVQLNKKEHAIWNKIGTSLNLNDSLCEMTLADKFFRPSQLVSKKQLTHDTYLFEFKLNTTLMYVPIGWHVLIREHQAQGSSRRPGADNSGSSTSEVENKQELPSLGYDERIYKNYTPVLDTLTGHDGLTDESGFMPSLFFIIKLYQDGVVTGKLRQLKLGDMVDISDYQCVDFDIETLVNGPKKHWILLAAGTGITPFCRVIPYLLSQTDELVESVTLVFFNKTQKDIIWRDEFQALASAHETRFKVVHVLSEEAPKTSAGAGWTGKRGKVSRDLVAEFADTKSPDELQILCCGPRPFTQLTKTIVNELNLTEKLYIFHG